MSINQRKLEQKQARWNAVPEWWSAVPEGEKMVLQAIVQMLRAVKTSPRPDTARAASKGERGIRCFIRVRLINARRGRRAVEGGLLRVDGKLNQAAKGQINIGEGI